MDPVLKKKCQHIDNIDGNLVTLTENMIETMYKASGLGLAANQVGVSSDLFVIDVGIEKEKPDTVVIINPIISASEDEIIDEESCKMLIEKFENSSDNYEEVKSRVYGASTEFYGTIAAINTKLQLGTTPGNPVLVRQYDQAQSELDNIEEYMREINLLNQKVNADAGVVALLKSTLNKTLRLAGAIDQDHRQLEVLEDDTEKLEIDIARLINEITEEISRQAGFTKIENQNMLVMAVAIRNGEAMGTGILNRSFLAAQALADAGAPDEQLTVPRVKISGLPLVVIRFDDPDIDYEKTLFDAIGTTVDKKPGANFGLVAVAPIGKNEGETRINSSKVKKYAERVLRSLVSFGLPSKKVALSAKTSGDVVVPEVHIYVQ